ncbi:putative membrane protein YesL [Sphingomonas zeicaulis]|uniref:hypothetical protein n=1 Tax=Sphingomonas zeicaulis TaxID=1632740 RepID=UPI003D239AFF
MLTRAALVLLLIAFALAAFCVFGLFTATGARAFDEMDGLIPFFAGCLSAVMTAAAIILWSLSLRRRR